MGVEELYPNSFDVSFSNFGLCYLVIDSAGQIDFERRGKKTDIFKANPVKKLSEILADFSRNLENDPTNVDGFGIAALWETLRKYKGNENIKYTHELAPKVKDIAEELGNIGKLPRERLKTLEKFCIALGDNVSVYAKPFRKYLVA